MVTKESYLKLLKTRGGNALRSFELWRECIAIFFFGSMGFWIPYFFNWEGYDRLFDPKTIFTFGVATIVMILEARLFLDVEQDNRSPNVTKLIIFVGSFTTILFYFKSISIYPSDPECAFYLVILGLFFTFLIWLFNFINRSDFDGSGLTGSLGGDV